MVNTEVRWVCNARMCVGLRCSALSEDADVRRYPILVCFAKFYVLIRVSMGDVTASTFVLVMTIYGLTIPARNMYPWHVTC